MLSAKSDSSSHPHASWWQLFAVFSIALLLFLGLRMQPGIWLDAQIQKQAKQQDIIISYDRLQIHLFTLQIENLSIRSEQLPGKAILLDTLTLTPAWTALLAGHIAVQVHTQWHGQSARAVLFKQDGHIFVQDISADIDASKLQAILNLNLALAVQASGQLHLSGSIQLHSNGHPLQGNLNLSWRAAALDLSSSHIALGDYKLRIQNNQSDLVDQSNSKDQSNSPWQWFIDGGKALTLTGKGQLDTTSASPQAWTLHGKIQIQANKEAAILNNILGSKSKQFSLSGNIMQAQLRAF